VAARFSEIIIQRLNQVPQKNFLAFLDLLGASLLAPEPASVPLTFYLAKGSVGDGLVPAGTQVAAPPSPGAKDPIIYETEDDLVVSAAQLAALFVRDPERDAYADNTAAISSLIGTGDPVFHGNRKSEHILYVGDQLLRSPGITSVSLAFTMPATVADPLAVRWEYWDGSNWQDTTPSPANDSTNRLQQSGTVVLPSLPPASPLTLLPAQVIDSISNNWLRCRLMTPITPESYQRNGMVRSSQLPQLKSILMTIAAQSSATTPAAAFANQTPIDLTKDFYPFGEKPRFGDSLFLALDDSFAQANSTVTIHLNLTNPIGSKGRTPLPVNPSDDLVLQWELWNGKFWSLLGFSKETGPQPKAPGFGDTTNALSVSGAVTFVLPAGIGPTLVNGVERLWVRARIVAGDYGVEATYLPSGDTYKFQGSTFQPPVIASASVDYQFSVANHVPDSVLAYNDFLFQDFTQVNSGQIGSFAPFAPMQDERPTFYFGFSLPAGRTSFNNSTFSLFVRTADLKYGENTVPLSPDVSNAAADPGAVAGHRFFLTNGGTSQAPFRFNLLGTQWQTVAVPAPFTPIALQAGQSTEIDIQITVPPGVALGVSDAGFVELVGDDEELKESVQFVTYAHDEVPQTQQLQLTWEYWDGQEWSALAVQDDTDNFSRDGVVEFLAPPDFSAHSEFDLDPMYWLRVRWEEGEFDREPRLGRVLPNTTMASQTVTVRNELLGSSDGSSSQSFQTVRTPVLSGQSLQVREPEMPSGDDLVVIQEEEGDDAVSVVRDSAGQAQEIWVRWHEVQDFYASASRSRHYTLNHLSGQISFGDGRSGMVPPVGTGNLRLALYKTGGGVRGNQPAGSIVQLKTTLPYVDRVANLEPATGGAEAESADSLVARAPTEIRHRQRAVTTEDYEDLAHLASPDVARALCVSNRDLVADPFDEMPAAPGNVSVIIVPNSVDPSPQPSFELLNRVQDSLEASSPATVNVFVVGPFYIRVDVQVEIGLASLEGSGTVVQKVQNQLAAFLHPLTGGFDQNGWEFGREPHRSDLYSLIKQIPEADHVRSLVVQEVEDSPGSRETGRFLVYSGNHTISLVFEPS
jgi:Baseplate J-like protein